MQKSRTTDDHCDRPACLALLGDVAGRTVLDAACGPGLYAEELTARGAKVIGFDQSPRMAELSRQRVPSGDFRAHDLADPLHWLADDSVDLVLFALALEYVDDRAAALRELRRVLCQDGAIVLSRQHPFGDWLRHGGNYFDARVIDEVWSRGGGFGIGLRRLSGRVKNCTRQASSSSGCSSLARPRTRPRSTANATSG